MKERIGRRKGRTRSRTRAVRAACALLALAIAALPAIAQEEPGQTHWQTPPDTRGLPREDTAIMLSVVGTAVSAASFFASYGLGHFGLVPLFAGPSLGAMYGGLWGRALIFTGLRFAGTLALAAAAYDHDALGLAYVWVGGMALSAVIEIATVGHAVHTRNERRLAQRGLKVEAAPFALPKGGGIQVRLSF